MTIPDYSSLIDAETWAYIDQINSFYPPSAMNLPIEENRAIYDRMSRAFHTGYPPGVTSKTRHVALGSHSIPVRVYENAAIDPTAIILYLHGGGFILGSLDSHDDICADLCTGTGYRVVSAAYRLAPEHIKTAAFEDAMAAFEWTARTFSIPVLLVGESAGGSLAASIAHSARTSRYSPHGQILVYPTLGGATNSRSYVMHADAPLLNSRDVDIYLTVRFGDEDFSDDPRYMPLADTNFSNLPPTFIITAQCDPLSSDGEIYCNRVLAGGGKAFWLEEAGLVHGFLRARHSVERAKTSFKRIIGATRALAGNL